MVSFKEVKSIVILFSISIILMFTAIFTATMTFALPEDKLSLRVWDVAFSELKLKEESALNVVKMSADNIDFHVVLKTFGESFSYTFDIANNGDFDAYLSSFNKTDLREIKVGTSNLTNRTYYVSDYVTYSVKYLENNKENDIIVDAPLKYGDLLHKSSKNKVIVQVKYKDLAKLTNDQIEVLKDNLVKSTIDGNEYLAFQLDLNLNVVYQELK